MQTLQGANLAGADLTSANLTGADLTGTHLFYADQIEEDTAEEGMIGADLISAYHPVDLPDKAMTGVDLRGGGRCPRQDLTGANLRGRT